MPKFTGEVPDVALHLVFDLAVLVVLVVVLLVVLT